MIDVRYKKDKYGKELLLDCIPFGELLTAGLDLGQPHVTNFYEIILLSSGRGRVLVDGNALPLEPHSVLLFSPARPRQWLIDEPMDGYVILFEGEFVENFLKDELFLHRLHLFGNQPGLPLDEGKMNSLAAICRSIRQEIDYPQPDSYHLLRSYLYQLLIVLNREHTRHYGLGASLYSHTDALRFRQLLAANIREKQTVAEYANLLNMNRNRLNTLCQAVFGLEASTLIKNQLLNACKSELLLSDKTISEISFTFNFSAPSNFVRFFRARTGYSPLDYRQRHAN